MPQVFDVTGHERDLAWLATNYNGCTVLPARVRPEDTHVWRLVAIFVTEGPAVLKIETRAESAQAPNQPVAVTWPTIESPSTELDDLPPSPLNWSPRGVLSRTGPDGIYGAGLGSTFGPFYHAWVVSSAPSDCLSRAGMKGGTNHQGPLHGVWVVQPVNQIPPDEDILEKLNAMHNDLRLLMQHLGAL